jgi:hypothetical protein
LIDHDKTFYERINKNEVSQNAKVDSSPTQTKPSILDEVQQLQLVVHFAAAVLVPSIQRYVL